MVIIGRRSGGDREVTKPSEENLTASMATERSRSNLHNFSLPSFKWGEQRQLRCVKAADDRRSPRTTSKPTEPNRKRRSHFESPENFGSPSSPPEYRRRASISGNDGGIEAVSKRIMLDFHTQVDRMKSAVLSEGSEEIEPSSARAAEAGPRPWNLRNRRGLCKDTNADDRKPSFPLPTVGVKSPARRSDFDGGDGGEKRPRAKLRVPLTKQEVEEDFVAMTGIRPPRKPKKRPRHVQKQIDRFLPGLWLSEIRASMYKVNENADLAKI